MTSDQSEARSDTGEYRDRAFHFSLGAFVVATATQTLNADPIAIAFVCSIPALGSGFIDLFSWGAKKYA